MRGAHLSPKVLSNDLSHTHLLTFISTCSQPSTHSDCGYGALAGSLVPPAPTQHPSPSAPSGCTPAVCVWRGWGCLDVLGQTWSKDFNLPPSGPHFLKSSSEPPAEANWACLLSGCPVGRRQGPSSGSMTFPFLSLRLPKSPSKVKGGPSGTSLTTHVFSFPCPTLPSVPSRAQSKASSLLCPSLPYPCPPKRAGGCLEKAGILCLIMEQALGEEAAPRRGAMSLRTQLMR